MKYLDYVFYSSYWMLVILTPQPTQPLITHNCGSSPSTPIQANIRGKGKKMNEDSGVVRVDIVIFVLK